jgi:phage/plasmid-associated DNA primase
VVAAVPLADLLQLHPRRLRGYTVPPELMDRHLTKKLQEELSGIFMWALAELKHLHANGHFTEPAICHEVLEEYRMESNPAKVFIRENVTASQNGSILCSTLYEAYVGWSKTYGHDALNFTQFGKELKKEFPNVDRKRATTKGHRPYEYVGVCLSAEAPLANLGFAISTVGRAA